MRRSADLVADLVKAVAAWNTAGNDPDVTTFHQLTEREFCLMYVGLTLVQANSERSDFREEAASLMEKLLDAARVQRGGTASGS